MLKEISSIKLQGSNFLSLTDLDLLDCKDGKLSKATLLYGRNGSGKSTIARAFKKVSGISIPTVSNAIVTDKDGNTISLTEEERKSIFVFDEDFVYRNVRIKEDGLSSIVMLGERVTLTEQIETTKGELKKIEADINRVEAMYKEFCDISNPKSPLFYISHMRSVLQSDDGWAGRERIIKKQRRNANVANDTYQSFLTLAPNKMQTDLIVEFNKRSHDLQVAENGTSKINVTVPTISDTYKSFDVIVPNELLKVEIEHSELSKREQYLFNLIQNGQIEELQERIEYLKKSEMSYCPYCLQDLAPEYKESLIQKIQQILTDEIKRHKEELKLYILPQLDYNLNEFSNMASCTRCTELTNQLNSAIMKNNDILQTKIDDPYMPIDKGLIDISSIAMQLDNFLKKLEDERSAYNQEVVETQPIIDDLIRINNEIAYYDVIELSKQHDVQVAEQQIAKNNYEDILKAYEFKKATLEKLDAQRKDIDVAIDVINNELKYIFFAENRLKIEVEGDSYKIISNGHHVLPKDISVGERNIIGLCYFFTSILQGKDKKTAYNDEYLIVIDDPVSSYDFENKVGILSFLKFKLGQFLTGNLNSRAIIMTHDLLTYFDIEKIYEEFQVEWNKLFTGHDTKYNLYELSNCTINRFQYKKRQEYTELVKMVYKYGYGNTNDYDIVIGNVMRQMLEAFSTFEYKKGIIEISTDDKILSTMDKEYETYFKNLMYRLVLNNGSHREEQSRSMEVDFLSAISEQEKRRTAKEIICFIYLLNKSHLLAHLGDVSETIDSWCEEIKNRAAII